MFKLDRVPDDFVIVPIKRGLDEILPILEALEYIDAFICGGYARYCASPNEGRRLVKAGDVDIYCRDESVFEDVTRMFKNDGMEVRFETEVAITYLKPKDKQARFYGCPVIQVIKPLDEGAILSVGDMPDILRNFDFTVIRCGIIWDDNMGYVVMADEDFIHDESKKLLRIKNIHCPISSLLRFMKYGSKGYHARPSQVAKLFADWDGRDNSYRERLLQLFEEGGELGELSQEEINELERLLRVD